MCAVVLVFWLTCWCHFVYSCGYTLFVVWWLFVVCFVCVVWCVLLVVLVDCGACCCLVCGFCFCFLWFALFGFRVTVLVCCFVFNAL